MMQDVYSLLNNNNSLKALTKGIYPQYPDTFTSLPVISFEVIQSENIQAFNNVSVGEDGTIHIDIWSNSIADNEAIKTVILESLQNTYFIYKQEQNIFEYDTKIRHKVLILNLIK